MIERHYSLRQAAKAIGIDRHTLKAWLAADLAIEFPKVNRGSKLLIRESQLEAVLRCHGVESNFARRRRMLSALHQVRRTA